jgi:hypothetical protein
MNASIIIPLDEQDFSPHTWVRNAPEGATSVEIRLIQPKGKGDLLVESVSLSRADVVSVPLILLSEAPGELTVSDLRVAYDLPEPPAGKLLSRGLGAGRQGRQGGGEDTETRRHGDTGKEFTASPRLPLTTSYSPSPWSPNSEESVISEPPIPVINIYPEKAASSSTLEPVISDDFTYSISNYSEEIPDFSTLETAEKQEESYLYQAPSHTISNYSEKNANVYLDISASIANPQSPIPNPSNIDEPAKKLPPPSSRKRRKKSPKRAIIRLLKILFKKLRRFVSSLVRRLFSFAQSGNRQSAKIRQSQRTQQPNIWND